MKEIIVGIDVGTNVGIAVVSFDGKVILLESKRGISEEEIINIIEKCGKPVVIATDVKDPPDSVRKIAAHFKAKLFSPKKDLHVEEKKELTRGFKYKNIHERDALAAALYFLRISMPLFRKIDREVYERVYKEFRDKVKEKILLGESKNIEEAIRELTEGKEIIKEVYIIKKSGRERDLERKIGELREKIREYKKEIRDLKEKLRRKRVRKEKEYIIVDEKLRKKVERLETIIRNLEEELRRKEMDIEMYSKYIRMRCVSLRKLSEILDLWKYLPTGIVLDVFEIDVVNKKIIKVLREIDPREILYENAKEKLLNELEREGFVLRKKRLKKEDILRIFSKQSSGSS